MKENKINIVHFHNGKGGGVLSVIRNLLAYSKNENIRNHIIFTIEKKQFPNYNPPEIKGAVSAQVFYYSQNDNFYYTCKQLAKLLPDDKAVIVAHDWLELGMVSNLGLQNPVVQILHGDYGYYYELAKKHAMAIDTFITVAGSIAKKLQQIIPGRTHDIKYLRFPVPENHCKTEKSSSFSIVYIGRCTKEKGYDVLPKVAQALLEGNFKIDWHIVGEIDEKAKQQFQWPKDAAVTFHGVLNNRDVQKLLCATHFILLPSLAEGMPVAVIEAMKAGVIPVVNDIPGGIQELVENGIAGFKIENNTIEHYKEKIIYLIKNPVERFRMQENVKDYADKYFNPLENALNYEKAILETSRQQKKKKADKIYGSRLDQVWLPNIITNMLRG